jgi:2-iminobutanoate/2-iminopropanoate deaminase
MTFFLQPDVPRALINDEWVKAFPHEASRPARHVIVSQTLSPRMLMQCDVCAIVSGGAA